MISLMVCPFIILILTFSIYSIKDLKLMDLNLSSNLANFDVKMILPSLLSMHYVRPKDLPQFLSPTEVMSSPTLPLVDLLFAIPVLPGLCILRTNWHHCTAGCKNSHFYQFMQKCSNSFLPTNETLISCFNTDIKNFIYM